MGFLFLLFAADPTGIQGALESSDSATIKYVATGQTVVLTANDCKEFAKLIEFQGEPRLAPGLPWTREIYEFRIGDLRVVLFSEVNVLFEDKLAVLRDSRLWDAIRKHIPPGGPKIVQIHDCVGRGVAVSGEFVIVGEPSRLSLFRHENDKLVHIESHQHDKLHDSLVVVAHNGFIYVASHWGDAIVVYELREGRLSERNVYEGFKQPCGLAFSSDHKHLYVVSFERGVDAFAVDQDGGLTHIQTVNHEKMELPTAIAVHPQGKAVYVVTHRNALVTFERSRKGELTFATAEVDENVSGFIKPRDRGLMFASAIAAANDTLYIAGLSGRISLWKTDSAEPVFVDMCKARTSLDGQVQFNNCALGKNGYLWLASGKGSLIWFEQSKDGLLKQTGQMAGMETARAIARGDGYLYVVGDKLWVIKE